MLFAPSKRLGFSSEPDFCVRDVPTPFIQACAPCTLCVINAALPFTVFSTLILSLSTLAVHCPSASSTAFVNTSFSSSVVFSSTYLLTIAVTSGLFTIAVTSSVFTVTVTLFLIFSSVTLFNALIPLSNVVFAVSNPFFKDFAPTTRLFAPSAADAMFVFNVSAPLASSCAPETRSLLPA